MVGGFDKDVLEKFYSLTPDQLARLLNIYSDAYGSGATSEGESGRGIYATCCRKKRGEIKYGNASRDIANFVHNADLMDQRKKDYQMSGQFESAFA